MGKERDDDTGQYTATTTDAEILRFLRAADGAGTSDVADEFDYEQPTAYRRLRALEDQGRVTAREVGPALFWAATEDTPPADTHTAESATQTDSADFDRETWHDRLTDEVASKDDVAARRAEAILGMYDHLREHGEADTDTLRELPDPETVNYTDADSVWSNMVKGEDTLRALPGVEPPAPGTGDPWRYTDDTDE